MLILGANFTELKDTQKTDSFFVVYKNTSARN